MPDPELPEDVGLKELQSDVADTEDNWDEAGADIHPELGDGP